MLETEFLKLKYHNNVESNTDEVDAEEYFNNNYKKIDANAKKNYEDLIKLKADLEQENTDLANNMPWNTVQGKSLHITDSAKYSKNKLNISGDIEETLTDSTQEKSVSNPATINTVTGVQMIRQFGKNFIPYPYANSTMTARGINYVSNSDGSISISGTSNSNIADFYLFGNSTDNGNYLHLKQDTYFLKDTENANIIYIAREKTLGVLVGINTILQALKTQDCYFYGFFIRVNNGATVNTVIYPQLSLGNTDTEYEPYWEQIHTLNLGTTQLCAIKDTNGDVVAKDRPVYRNGKWQWEKNIGKYTFTGVDTDGYDFNSDNTNTLAVNLIINKKYEVVKKFNNVLSMCCDKFNFINNVNDIEHIYITSATTIENGYKGNIRLYINKDRLSGYNSSLTNTQKANLVKTWLQSNPSTVYYILVTPEYIDCTTEQSTVLDKLYNNFELQKGTNNIIVESENGVTVDMELTYMQDNNLKDKKLEERITTLENLLSTTQTSALLLENLQSDLESEVN